ncbi:MAG: ATP-binding protein [Pseudomonadota bacterium]
MIRILAASAAAIAGACLSVTALAVAGFLAIDDTGINIAADRQIAALPAALAGGALLAALGYVLLGLRGALRERDRAHSLLHSAQEHAARAQRDFIHLNDVLASENQAVVRWDLEGSPRVIVNTLPGAARDDTALLKFATWLPASEAARLTRQLSQLIDRTTPFARVLAPTNGRRVVAIGHSAVGRPLLILRELTGDPLRAALRGEEHAEVLHELANYRRLFDQLPVLVWFTDTAGRLVWVNTAYAKLLHAGSRTQLIEQQQHLLDADTRHELLSRCVQSAGDGALAGSGETGPIAVQQRVAVSLAGNVRAYDLQAAKLDDVVAYFASDITPLEDARAHLSRLAEAYNTTLDKVSSAVVTFGADARLVFHNDAFNALTGVGAPWLSSGPKEGEILDRLREKGLVPYSKDYRRWKRDLIDQIRSEPSYEDWWHLADGRTLHVIAARRADAMVTYLFDDVTEKLELESRFNEQLNVQGETLDNLTEGVAVFGTDGRLRLANSSLSAIWKLDEKQIATRPHVDAVIEAAGQFHNTTCDWTSVRAAVLAIPEEREPHAGQMERTDGAVIAYRTLPLPDGSTLVTFEDITDRALAANALIERNEALEAADKLKTAFVSHISYELRTPLTNIIGFAELLSSPRTGNLNAKQREYLSDIHGSSKSLQTIISDILDLVTIDAGSFELRLVSTKPDNVIDRAVAAMSDRFMKARIQLEITIDPDAGSFIADETRAAHVIYNLLANAVSYSEDGSVVQIRAERRGELMAFEISDNGCGIPEERQQTIFERFEGNHSRGRRRGAGLGLAIVRGLVELHGGSVALSSQVGVGTTVEVLFPLAPAQSPSSADEALYAADARAETLDQTDEETAAALAETAQVRAAQRLRRVNSENAAAVLRRAR